MEGIWRNERKGRGLVYKLGPAPRSLDRFKIQVDEAGTVFVDTTQVVIGPPRGTDTTGRPRAGPFCVAAG